MRRGLRASRRDKLPFKRSFIIIILSILIVSGIPTALWVYYRYVMLEDRFKNPDYNITRIVQMGPQREPLSAAYLAELMDLSVDQPSNLYLFNEQVAEYKLLKSPLIKTASVRTIKPSIVYVEYTLRELYAELYDLENTALDHEGVLLPILPFFTPKRLPQIYLGLQADEKDFPLWGEHIAGEPSLLALQILHYCRQVEFCDLFHIHRIDVSMAEAESYGQRQVILSIEEELKVNGELFICPRILRLSPRNYQTELSRYLVIRGDILLRQEQAIELADQVLPLNPIVIDFRLPELAYINWNL